MCSLACQLLPLCMEIAPTRGRVIRGVLGRLGLITGRGGRPCAFPMLLQLLQLHFPITHVYYDLVV